MNAAAYYSEIASIVAGSIKSDFFYFKYKMTGINLIASCGTLNKISKNKTDQTLIFFGLNSR